METLDWLVIGIFFLALIGIIVWVVKQKQNDSADYFLGGRDATWLAIGASIFASNIGSEHLIGLAGAGASSGMAMAHWEIQGWMILILGWVFVPFYSRSMVFTMPEFLERRYNPQSRTILSVISLISYVLTKVAVTVYAGGLVFQQVFGIKELWGIDFFWIAAIGLVILTALYTIFGGMKSVLYTSILQTPILLLGSLIILVLGFKELGGWDEMMRICGAVTVNDYGNTMTELIRSNNDPNFPWLGALIGSAIIGFWYWCTDQFIVQRVLSGKNEKEARRGTIFGAYLKLLPVFLFLIPGMIAFALHQKYLGTGGNLLKYKERKAHDFKNQLVFEIKELDYTSIDEDFMQRAIDCVNRHLEDSDFDQPQFVEEMGTSKSTLYKKLKSLTGLNTSAFIRNIRLKAACRIMEEKGSSVRISDLAYAVGFNDPKYFSSCFKKEFGMLPTEYQERFIQS